MKKNYTHISFVLDRSGSMMSIKDDTIGGFNSFLKDQQKEKGDCTFSMIQFDDTYENLYSFISIKKVKELNDDTFIPRSMTALYDALGRCIIDTGDKLKNLKEEERPEKVLFVILTDGEENSSREFSQSKIKKMIEHQQEKYNWKFIYLGANQDACLTAQGMGIHVGNSLSFGATKNGMKNATYSISKNISKYRNMSSEVYFNCNDIIDDEDRDLQKDEL